MFRDRLDAAMQLARALEGRRFHDPLVLAIPRGGVVLGAVLARELGAELDVVLARKLRAPDQPELAIGAVSEAGETFLNDIGQSLASESSDYLIDEREFQLAEIARRKKLVRGIRPPAAIAGRTVIVTDDGIATGSTMLAALQTVRLGEPRELIVAVPVGAPDRLDEIAEHCDEVVCLRRPSTFWAIGHFYQDFRAVEDEEVIRILRDSSPRRASGSHAPRAGSLGYSSRGQD